MVRPILRGGQDLTAVGVELRMVTVAASKTLRKEDQKSKEISEHLRKEEQKS